ncbi:MAG: hypothetical protein HKL90_11985 [Elusimicrobia bacterium]|nr:hypothetical protein [Elusimicrobiota bacterium]
MNMQDEDGAPATKGDLNRARSEMKTEMENLRAQLRAESDRLDRRIGAAHRGLAVEIVKTHERIDRVENNLRGEIRDSNSRILKAVEGFMSQVGKTDRAQIIADWRLSELEKRMALIEPRPS